MTEIQVKTSVSKSLLTVILLLSFVSLGVWQLNRAQEKIQIRDQFLARAQLPKISVGAELLNADGMAFRAATASGHYLEDYQILLDNKVHNGQAGYHVLTPLLLSNTRTLLLVNRGWVSWGIDRLHLPKIDTPQGQVNINGRLVVPAQPAINLEKDLPVNEFRLVWQNLDIKQYALLTGHSVQSLVLRLAPEEIHGGGLVREWPRYQDIWIQRHHGYALQWFGLAIVLVVIFLFSSIKRKPQFS